MCLHESLQISSQILRNFCLLNVHKTDILVAIWGEVYQQKYHGFCLGFKPFNSHIRDHICPFQRSLLIVVL